MSEHVEYFTISVGDPLPECMRIDSDNVSGAVVNYDKHDFGIRIFASDVEPHERLSVSSGSIRIGIFKHNDALFFLINITDVLIFEMPFDITRVHPDLLPFPEFDRDEGRALHITLIDNKNDWRVEALRVLSVGPLFCSILQKQISNLEKKVRLGTYDFNAGYIEAIEKYSSPIEMFKDSLVIENAGKEFSVADKILSRSIKG